MADHNHTPECDPAHVAQTEHIWKSFTKFSTQSVIVIIAIVVLLALFVA